MKEETLADAVLGLAESKRVFALGARTPKDLAHVSSWWKAHLRRARVFSLDEQVAHAVSELVAYSPDILLRLLPLARAPFPLTWVEWPAKSNPDPLRPGQWHNGFAPEPYNRIGVLLEQLDPDRQVYRATTVVAYDRDEQRDDEMEGADRLPAFSPSPVSVVFDLNGPVSLEEWFSPEDYGCMLTSLEAALRRTGQLEPDDGPEAVVERLISGLVPMPYPIPDSEDREATRQEIADFNMKLARHATHQLSPPNAVIVRDAFADLDNPGSPWAVNDGFHFAMASILTEYVLDWRSAVAFLAMYNQREYVTEVTARAGGRRFVRGKSVAYLAHRRVSLKLPRRITLNGLFKRIAAGLPRRRHEVEGHWCHSHTTGDPNCHHRYTQATENLFVCQDCEHRRWWRDAHERGDAGLGYVTREKVIEAAGAGGR